jgi:hypothetical protein
VSVLRDIGATPPERPNETSSTRVTMFATFIVFVLFSAFVAVCIAFGVPKTLEVTDAQGVVQTVTTTWMQWEGFFKEVTATLMVFLIPYGVGRLAGAYEKKKG